MIDVLTESFAQARTKALRASTSDTPSISNSIVPAGTGA